MPLSVAELANVINVVFFLWAPTHSQSPLSFMSGILHFGGVLHSVGISPTLLRQTFIPHVLLRFSSLLQNDLSISGVLWKATLLSHWFGFLYRLDNRNLIIEQHQ